MAWLLRQAVFISAKGYLACADILGVESYCIQNAACLQRLCFKGGDGYRCDYLCCAGMENQNETFCAEYSAKHRC